MDELGHIPTEITAWPMKEEGIFQQDELDRVMNDKARLVIADIGYQCSKKSFTKYPDQSLGEYYLLVILHLVIEYRKREALRSRRGEMGPGQGKTGAGEGDRGLQQGSQPNQFNTGAIVNHITNTARQALTGNPEQHEAKKGSEGGIPFFRGLGAGSPARRPLLGEPIRR